MNKIQQTEIGKALRAMVVKRGGGLNESLKIKCHHPSWKKGAQREYKGKAGKNSATMSEIMIGMIYVEAVVFVNHL